MPSELKKIFKKSKNFYLNTLKKDYPAFNFKQHDKVILFGAAEMGKIYFDLCKNNNIKVLAFIDNDKSKWGKSIKKTKIGGIKKLLSYSKNTPIIITSIFAEDIQKQLNKLGFSKFWPYFYFSIFHSKKFHNPHWLSSLNAIFQDKNKIISCFNILNDKKSQKTLINLIKYRLWINQKFIKSIKKPIEKQYFDKGLVSFSKNEVFVDGGAYDGDTISQFLKAVNNKFRKIYAFEPDKLLFKKLTSDIRDTKIETLRLGLGNKEQIARFSGNGTPGSRIDKKGKHSIKIVPLDNFFEKVHPTFIKLDIEGAEIDALKGSTRIIKEFKPKLAICVYHKPSDLWNIPLLIKKINPDYKIYLRHYGNFLYDTICYAF